MVKLIATRQEFEEKSTEILAKRVRAIHKDYEDVEFGLFISAMTKLAQIKIRKELTKWCDEKHFEIFTLDDYDNFVINALKPDKDIDSIEKQLMLSIEVAQFGHDLREKLFVLEDDENDV